ncbi:hypothetical protein P152DRAFT_176979 [Eremomyces bilateralis CBS 781.70]|uniref:non-specific serine/threonine protein kinase n=1 Tax=Eremomyces bilateralis CBS 781.70 TaxID=1392243 RepID=A0A6G1FT85_9PEZI|nr:uncharacterized protein P152DRAFT_176979 [Eremomyces bilateralis CBS 781.70]KAF1808946.1 hypothetical protein P152DRAFT_176979 [Eremomyces bilateralis CBS 781.70]
MADEKSTMACDADKPDSQQEGQPITMVRSASEDMREERQDLKEAAEHNLNVIVDLTLDGRIRWVSPSWLDVIGTDPDSVKGKPIADFIVGEDKSIFANAVERIQQDDSRSKIIRFQTEMGPLSKIGKRRQLPHAAEESTAPVSDEVGEAAPASEKPEAETGEQDVPEDVDLTLELEAQGIIVFDRASGGESHTMWMMRPTVIREVTIDLPSVLVDALGVGAEMLAHYLNQLTESGASQDETGELPPPPPVLCRICERQIPPWWFERHTELCLQEHKAEMEVQMAHENLTDHRNLIVKVLDGLEAQSRQSRQPPTSGELSVTPPALPEYKGHRIGPLSNPSSTPSSGRASPATPPSRSRERPVSGLGHRRGRSFAVRRPIARIVELVLDLCDTALEINTPVLKETPGQQLGEFRTQSPQSENHLSQVMQWQSPSTSTLQEDQGLSTLCEDTAKLAKIKVDAILRHRRILEYSERIRVEFELLVRECIEAAIRKANRIAAGEDSTSSEDDERESVADRMSEHQSEHRSVMGTNETPPEEGIFPASFERPSSMSMAMALHNRSDPNLLNQGRRSSSAANSARSSSPRGGQTPRSHGGAMSFVPHSKRGSMMFESDAGADSDSSVHSSILSSVRRAESPGSEIGLSRVASHRDGKRKSLVLSSVMSSRQQSPARPIPIQPGSPLKLAKGKHSSSVEAQSPLVSPILSTGDFSSPAMQQVLHHRRQSSAASSEVTRPPLSPKLAAAATHPQPRAVAPSIKDFEIIKPISKGAFGSVYLSKKKSTGDYYAIKVLKKADMVAKNQVTNVKAERAIMMWQGESDFVAKLFWTFSSKDYLYLVMEYLNGGDVASLIKVLGGLPEDWAKKYLAEIVLGVDHLHSRNIIHRDLKPDNLLIDQKGHLKLTDFGLSRMGLIGRQKRALNSKTEEPAPDLLKQGPFHRATSITSSRSTSFDFHGNNSPSQTPSLTPALTGEIGTPSYFSLNRENSKSRDNSRRTSGHRSDSEHSEALQMMFRKFSLVDEPGSQHTRTIPIEEEAASDMSSPDPSQPGSLSHANTNLSEGNSHGGTTQNSTPPNASMLPPPMALFDPKDTSRRFVGTPDYLAPETIHGVGQDETSDWWSLGCILFEMLYGYPPFHADTPDQVFQNILDRKIDWPTEEQDPVSPEAKDLMNKLMCLDHRSRLGSNVDDNYSSGGEEIKAHPWFAGVNWTTVQQDEASFVPQPENPEDTDYFDSRGATIQTFAAEFEDQGSPSGGTSGDFERPHDALAKVRNQVNNLKRGGLMPLHIPPHVRDGRNRRLSEPVAADDFGNFAYKNLPMLEKANKDVIQKLRAEAMQAQNKNSAAVSSPSAAASPAPSLEASPVLPSTIKRTMSSNKGSTRPVSPLLMNHLNQSPNRASQPSSPLLVSFSTGHHERRKTSGSSTGSQQPQPPSLQPGGLFDPPRLTASSSSVSATSSPIKLAKSPGHMTQDRTLSLHKHSSSQSQSGQVTSPRARSQTTSSQEGPVKDLIPNHHKRRSQVPDISPSSSDTEESRQKALLRVQRRRQSSRRLSQITLNDGPIFRPLDVLICEDHPVSRYVMEKLLEKLRCRTISVQSGPEAVRYAMSEVKFDIIMMEYRLPQINGADVARMVRDTKNPNSPTPIVCVTGYLKDLQAPHHFDALIEKPPTIAKFTEVLTRLCQWKPAPPGWTPSQAYPYPSPHSSTPGSAIPPSALRMESSRAEDSPVSQSSSFAAMPSASYRGSSRADSISSSFFGEVDARSTSDTNESIPVVVARGHAADEWRDKDLASRLGGLGISEEPLTSEVEDTKPLSHPFAPSSLLHQQISARPAPEQPVPRTPSQPQAAPLPQSPKQTPETARSRSPGLQAHPNTTVRKKSNERSRVASSSSAGPPDDASFAGDEDEELGDVKVRAKSPKHRARGSSKLGTEMLRTNSRGSVVSVEDLPGMRGPVDGGKHDDDESNKTELAVAHAPAVPTVEEDKDAEADGDETIIITSPDEQESEAGLEEDVPAHLPSDADSSRPASRTENKASLTPPEIFHPVPGGTFGAMEIPDDVRGQPQTPAREDWPAEADVDATPRPAAPAKDAA